MRRRALVILASAAAVAAATLVSPAGADALPATTGGPGGASAPGSDAGARDYVVLYAAGADASTARAAIKQAGGTLVHESAAVGFAVVRSDRPGFAAQVGHSPAVAGAVADRAIGFAPKNDRARLGKDDVERLTHDATAQREASRTGAVQATPSAVPAAEPLSSLQWDMRQIGATPTGSYAVQPGKRTVRVGIIDTGVDGSHPDIAANFDATDSRNFVTDMPDIDGPCEYPSCVDPVDHDDNEHGTHVASTIGSPINGIGIAGVAPDVSLLNLRAGQDSGYFFLAPTLEAITYAGEAGVDVINMSFYTDPWLFNCVDNPADSVQEQQEQRVIREATQRALDYARDHGVLPVAAMGNEFTDLGHPTVDDTSPDYPAGAAKTRQIDNSCITVPTESEGVVAVSSTGPSTRMAYYSNYGTEQTDVSAPGGDAYDSPGGTLDPRALVLAAYPRNVAEASGDLNPDGTPNNPFVLQSCSTSGTCAYYTYLQGTSMASPHAAGVAALIVSQYGRTDRQHGGLTLDPEVTQKLLERTAVDHACPQPRDYVWTIVRSSGTTTRTARCEGPTSDNGFYGNGIVNAYAAVTARK
jgi:lantibiotic leader peptide-processing serine protease